MIMAASGISILDVKNEIGETTKALRGLVLSSNVNRWGFNSPNAAQQLKYFSVDPSILNPPHQLGVFRRYDHTFRAYTWEDITEYVTDDYVGIYIDTQIVNETISVDPGTLTDFTFRCDFSYKNSVGNWVSGGYVTGTINKVGQVLLRIDLFYLGDSGATDVRITPYLQTGPERRWAPNHSTFNVVNEDADFYFYAWDSQKEGPIINLTYDNFDDMATLAAPEGSTYDGQGFINNMPYDDTTGVDLELWGFRIWNASSKDLTTTFKITFDSSSSFPGTDSFTVYQSGDAYSTDRAWSLPGEYNTIGTVLSHVVFEDIGNPQSWSSGQTIFCRLEIDVGTPSTVFDITYIDFTITWYFT